MRRELEGRAAIVTGAAHGVGLAVARLMAEEGASVLMTDPDEAALATETEALIADGAKVSRWNCNLREKLGVANLMAMAQERLGRIDILVNANLAATQGGFFDTDQPAFDGAIDTNARAVLLLSQAVARRMIEQAEARGEEGEAGAIVNVTSTAAQRTAASVLPYSVSCAALDQLTRSMAVSLAPKGVRVNGVAIGAVMTRALKTALREHEGLRKALIAATPMARIGEATEAAEAALFLASPRASFITGQILAVDGGRVLLDPLAALLP